MQSSWPSSECRAEQPAFRRDRNYLPSLCGLLQASCSTRRSTRGWRLAGWLAERDWLIETSLVWKRGTWYSRLKSHEWRNRCKHLPWLKEVVVLWSHHCKESRRSPNNCSPFTFFFLCIFLPWFHLILSFNFVPFDFGLFFPFTWLSRVFFDSCSFPSFSYGPHILEDVICCCVSASCFSLLCLDISWFSTWKSYGLNAVSSRRCQFRVPTPKHILHRCSTRFHFKTNQARVKVEPIGHIDCFARLQMPSLLKQRLQLKPPQQLKPPRQPHLQAFTGSGRKNKVLTIKRQCALWLESTFPLRPSCLLVSLSHLFPMTTSQFEGSACFSKAFPPRSELSNCEVAKAN